MISKRQFVFGSAALGLIGVLPLASRAVSSSQKPRKQWLISACNDNHGQHYAAAFDETGQLISRVALPARGHGVIAHPNKPGHGLIIARRPGYYAIEIDFTSGQIVRHIKPTQGQHFFGHGLFSSDGKYLITTENHTDTGQGKIVLRYSHNYRIANQFDSGGIGPHEALPMPDGKTMVVANGGILTHPDTPRKKLNLDTMAPNLSYIDIRSGKILAQYQLDNPKLSIRHLAISKTGKVIGGLQYQGGKTDLVPLAFSHQGQEPLQYLKAPDSLWQQMNQYTASICINDEGKTAAISCPRGNMVTYWNLHTGEFIKDIPLKDGAGLALFNNNIVATSGKGRAVFEGNRHLAFDNVRWDNHLVAIKTA